MAKHTFSILTLFIFSLLLTGFTSGGQIVSFIDHTFLAGLLFLIIGAVIHVIHAGVFSFFLKSFRKLNKLPGGQPEIDPDPMLQEERRRFYKRLQVLFFGTGLMLISTSVATLFFL
ncbi:MAG: DUF3899 domain-containing protein [Thermoactinomyces sp.]